MFWTVFLSILGIVATVVLGAWAIYIGVRHQYPGQITFVNEKTIRLFDEIVRNFSELSVLYEGKPVDPNLVLIEGSLLNTGRKDIDPQMVEHKLKCNLPEGFRWVRAKRIGATEHVQADVAIVNDTALEFTMGLLRRNEFVRFQALAAVPHEGKKDSSLEDSLSFSHRIADTCSVQKVRISSNRTQKRISRILSIVFSIYLSFGAFHLVYYFIRHEPVLVYSIRTDEGALVLVKVSAEADNTVKVQGISQTYSATFTLDQFQKRREGSETIQFQRRMSHLVTGIMTTVIALMAFGMICPLYLEERSQRRLRRILAV